MGREIRKEIIEATFVMYKKKGLKMTMDDLAKEIAISKKTIYNIFRSKDELFTEVVDYFFDKLKQEEKKILQDRNLSIEEKLRGVMMVLPEGYRDMDLRQMCEVKDKYPGVYRELRNCLEIVWENTSYLIQKGVDEGVFRSFNIPLFKMMFQTSVEQFFQNDILIDENIGYQDALNEIVGILIDGVTERDCSEK